MIYDITPPVSERLSVWPGETPPTWGFGGTHGLEGHEGDKSAAEGAVD